MRSLLPSWLRRRSGGSPPDIDPLTRLAIRHGTDKWGAHFYTPVYHQLFGHLRDKPVRLLEIGVGGYGFVNVGGASLAMWAEYFPNGQITGIDVAPKQLAPGRRIHLRQGSQDDATFLARVSDELGPFDIVIDDGSHVPAHVVASFQALFPRLPAGARYVIEDVQTSYWPKAGGSATDGGATVQLAKTILDNLNHAEIRIARPDFEVAGIFKTIRSFQAFHNLFVIEKGDNTEPSNFDFPLDNAHVGRAVRLIEQELATSPSAAGLANLVQVHVWANDLARASMIARDGLARWPDDAALLHAAYMVADRADDAAGRDEYRTRLAVLAVNKGKQA